MRWRWYVIEGHPSSTAGGIAMDADEVPVCGTWTRRGAERIARKCAAPMARHNIGYRVVLAKDWETR